MNHYPLFLFFIAILPSLSLADDKIIVTATKSAAEAGNLPFSVGEVSGEGWEQAGGKAEDALALLPGASVSASGGPGQLRSLRIRGANAEHTLVLIDGIPVNDPLSPSRSFDFGQIPAGEIDRIEMIAGPQSVLYGSDALGGVVQIFTRKDAQARARVEGGSYGTFLARVSDLGFHAGYERSDGFSAADKRLGNTEPDGYRRWNLGGHQDVELGEKALAKLTAQYSEARTDTDWNGGRGGDSRGTGNRLSRVLFRDENVIFLPEGFEWTLAGNLASHDRDDNTNGNDYYRSTLWKAESILRKSFGAHSLTGGAEYAQEAGASSQIAGRHRFRFGALYLQDQLTRGRFEAVAGARLDLHSETGSAATWRMGLGYWLVPETLRARGSLGTGFKAPTLYQTYSIYGTPGLRPERSLGGDLGLEWKGEDWSTSLTWYQNWFKDMMDTRTISMGPPLVARYYNLKRAESYGAEWAAERRFGLFELRNSLTTLRAIDRDTRQLLYRRAALTDSFQAGFRKGDFVGASLLLRYVGRRDEMEPVTGTRQPMPPFTTLGLSFFHHVGWGARFVGRVENLLNRQYEEVSGYGVPALSAYGGIEADL